MSSAIFAAHNAFVCALSGKTFPAGTPSFYLTCAGNVAIPAAQIEASKKDTGFETGYRCVKTGSKEVKGRGGRTYWKPVFGFEQKIGRSWVRVVTWSNLVAVSEARERGFRVSGKTTEAMRGKRTVGHEHEVSNEVTEVEQTTEEAVAEAEAMLAKINAVAPDAPMLPASEPTVEDVAKAFASWGA